MKGAIAEPSVRKIKAPNSIRKITIGANQYFFRILRNSQNSKAIESLLIVALLFPKTSSHSAFCHIISVHFLSNTFFHSYQIV
jgi:hypothetical protein